jgi:anti-sigma factor RsiW
MSGVDPPLALTCKEFVEVITEYLDGTLPPTEVARIDGHLAGCAGCRAYLSQMRQTITVAGVLGDLPGPGAPVADETKRRLLDAFRARRTTPPDAPR